MAAATVTSPALAAGPRIPLLGTHVLAGATASPGGGRLVVFFGPPSVAGVLAGGAGDGALTAAHLGVTFTLAVHRGVNRMAPSDAEGASRPTATT